MEILTTTIYKSRDGFYEFKTQKECEEYEKMLDNIKYFRVAYHPNLEKDGHYERMWWFGVNLRDMDEAYNIVFGYMLYNMEDHNYINPYLDTFIPYFIINECTREQFFNATEDTNTSKTALIDEHIKDAYLPFPEISYEKVHFFFKHYVNDDYGTPL